MGLRGVAVIGKLVPKIAIIHAWVLQFAAISSTMLMMIGCADTEQKFIASGINLKADTKVVTVTGQKLTLGRAAGYCFNDNQSKIVASGAFVVLAPCDPTNQARMAKGLILINVLAKSEIVDTIQVSDLESFFQSYTGRAILNREDSSVEVTVLGTMKDDGIYYVHTKAAGGPIIQDTTDDQWRAFMVVADHLVSVRVVNFVNAKLTEGLVFAHMESIARRIQALN